MRIRHTQKVLGRDGTPSMIFKPDDQSEPPLGAIVEVSEALGLALITRGWGVDADKPTDQAAELADELEV